MSFCVIPDWISTLIGIYCSIGMLVLKMIPALYPLLVRYPFSAYILLLFIGTDISISPPTRGNSSTFCLAYYRGGRTFAKYSIFFRGYKELIDIYL